MTIRPDLKTLAITAIALAFAIPFVTAGAGGASNAANKTSAAGSTIEFLSDPVTGGTFATAQTVLSTTMKTSAPQDLILSVSLECALWTTVQTVGNDVSQSTARVEISVLFDGVEVPVGGSDPDGTVVFCDRVHRQTTTMFDDENATIESYLATRSANAFNWLLPDAGQGVHLIEVVAELTGEATDNAVTQAAVGHRTLIVEPTHLAHGFQL